MGDIQACDSCDGTNIFFRETPRSIHHGQLVCGDCNRVVKNVPKPNHLKAKKQRSSSHRKMVKNYGRGFCELCLMKVDDLPDSQPLQGHHIIEYANGGDESKDNTWILCTGCHEFITLIRSRFRCHNQPN